MVIWGFNEDSVLNRAWVRVLNGIILIPFLLLIMSTDVISVKITPLSIIYILASVGVSISYTLKRIKWLEVDKKESKRKESFIITYCCISIAYAFIIATLIESSIVIQQYNINIVLILYFVFNKINLCSLLNFGDFFTDKLSSYIESPCKLSEADLLKAEEQMIKHVLNREHNIDVDELIFQLKRERGIL